MIDRTESHLIAQERRNRSISDVTRASGAHGAERNPERRLARRARAAGNTEAARQRSTATTPKRSRRAPAP